MRSEEELKELTQEQLADEYNELRKLYYDMVGSLYPQIAYAHLMTIQQLYDSRRKPNDPYLKFTERPNLLGYAPTSGF
jgi:hypothetical protein